MPDNITKILNSVRKDCWTKKLKDIKDRIEKYDELKTGTSSHTKEEIEAHLNEILPTYWDVFHTHNTYRREEGELLKRSNSDKTHLPHYDIGIFLVGYSSLPIAFSLAEIQPVEQIYFLYSSDTREYLGEIFDRLSAMLNSSNHNWLGLVENTVLHNLDEAALAIDKPSDPVSIFKRIKEIIDNIDDADNKRIALDLTGGKKTMLGGGYAAGTIWASRWSAESKELSPFCDMYYIDSLEYDPTRGSPVHGTEFLSQLKNPYDVYNVQSVWEAKKLFEKHNYEAAAELLERVKDKLAIHAIQYGLVMEKDETVNHHRQANCYYLWDAFYYDKAKNGKNRHKNSWGYNEKHVKNSIDVLEILSEVKDRSTLFENDARIVHYAIDRYQNAIRRKKSGKLEDAIVRFTQVIEMLCNYRIYQLAQDDDLINSGKSPAQNVPADEKWELKRLICLLFGTSIITWRGNDYYVSPCKKLDVSDYSYKNVPEITKLIQPRHDFIHFNSPMKQTQTKKDAEALQELAKKFLKNFSVDYCTNNRISFDELLELHKFYSELS